MRKYTALAVAAIAAVGLVSCTPEAAPIIENTTETTMEPADRVPKSVGWETGTEFEGTNIVRYTLETSDGRLVDCFVYDDYRRAGGLSCIPLETEPATE